METIVLMSFEPYPSKVQNHITAWDVQNIHKYASLITNDFLFRDFLGDRPRINTDRPETIKRKVGTFKVDALDPNWSREYHRERLAANSGFAIENEGVLEEWLEGPSWSANPSRRLARSID